ncbi:unnamed protein product [Spirodela intermedia]|uniref:rRNA adenine N(6)-methyltransferase n=1 Tax=Spirodela intermedia TaxID=51605 RepID=A0A7I8IGW2_SPIIN|nr:unnamed protein product [Spirodela intermedia]CAA6656303.1 unnamed protein product [Spirodela intermedia]
MACLLRSPPSVSAATSLSTREPSGTASRVSTVLRCSRRVVADDGREGATDDFHSTLRALNSTGSRRSRGTEVKDGDVVLEIGPGTGSLTNVLINSGATVIAIEKDPRMATLVRDRFEGVDRPDGEILQEDFTKCHVSSHVSQLLESKKSTGGGVKHAKVVANVPFNISTEIIKRLLPLGDIFSDVVLLLQDETAFRLVDSQLRTSEYRAINIFVNFFSDAEYRFKVDRTNFFPPVVMFKLKRPTDYPEVASVKDFFSMVNSAFNGKRKMLRKSLQHLRTPSEIEEALSDAGLPVTARPEELSLEDFVRLHNSLARAHD